MEIRGGAQAPQARFVSRVSRVEVEDHVRLGERAALLDELGRDRAQAFQPLGVDEAGQRQPTLFAVLGALPVGERHAYAVTSEVKLDRGPLPLLFVAFTAHWYFLPAVRPVTVIAAGGAEIVRVLFTPPFVELHPAVKLVISAPLFEGAWYVTRS